MPEPTPPRIKALDRTDAKRIRESACFNPANPLQLTNETIAIMAEIRYQTETLFSILDEQNDLLRAILELAERTYVAAGDEAPSLSEDLDRYDNT